VNDTVRRLRTEEQAERLHRARRQGGRCAACGREISAGETVYIERFEDRRHTWVNVVTAPVGVECISNELREDASGREPERCGGCGRPVHYRLKNPRRVQALGSHACEYRAAKRRQAGG